MVSNKTMADWIIVLQDHGVWPEIMPLVRYIQGGISGHRARLFTRGLLLSMLESQTIDAKAKKLIEIYLEGLRDDSSQV